MEPGILFMEDAARSAVPGELDQMTPTDDEIVRRVRDGDAHAYRLLLERHYPKALRFGIRMLGNRADAEEAVQDAFTRAYRSLGRYEPRQRFDSWLMTILVNRCRTAGARRDRRERTFVSYDVIEDFVALDDGPSEPRIELQRALALLSDEEREALLLKYLDDRTYEDMAALTGSGVSALKMRVKRARERLQALLGRGYDA
ncbi:MAG TPA: RNA polymerase sigma factor [Gemmatimonadaceae bacterium]